MNIKEAEELIKKGKVEYFTMENLSEAHELFKRGLLNYITSESQNSHTCFVKRDLSEKQIRKFWKD